MKTVFSNAQCAHVWAQQTQDHGRSSSMKFRGPRIYSYQTCIGMMHDFGRDSNPALSPAGRVALLNSKTYSMTTSSKHMPAVSGAVSHLPSFSVPDCEAQSPAEHEKNYASLFAAYNKSVAYLENARSIYGYDYLHSSAQICRDYARTFHLTVRPIDSEAMEKQIAGYRARREARLAADPVRARRIAKKEADRIERKRIDGLARVERDRENLIKFREGNRAYGWNLTDEQGGAYLRVAGDFVQTSRGAVVPIDDAKRAIVFIARQAPRGAWERNGETCPVGQFQIDSISPEGNIRAGCHFIQWPEIARLATALGI